MVAPGFSPVPERVGVGRYLDTSGTYYIPGTRYKVVLHVRSKNRYVHVYALEYRSRCGTLWRQNPGSVLYRPRPQYDDAREACRHACRQEGM